MNYKCDFYTSVDDIDSDTWKKLDILGKGTFHNYDFLKIQERTLLSQDYSFSYTVVSSDKDLMGFSAFQIKNFGLAELMGDGFVLNRLLKKYMNPNLMRVIICGDMVNTGVSQFNIKPNLSLDEKVKFLDLTLAEIKKKIKAKIGIILIKDLSVDTEKNVLKEKGFSEIQLAPIMTIKIPLDWKSLEDYKSSLKSRYRTALNSTQVAAAYINRKKLNRSDIKDLQNIIEDLYSSVYKKAIYKGPFLGSEYFLKMLHNLGESNYQVIGYFLDSKLIGFNSRYIDNNKVTSSFFGVDQEINLKYQLLRNMMVDDLKFAIDIKADSLQLGRSNYEMKSAMGAVPYYSFNFIKPLNFISLPLSIFAKWVTKPKKLALRRPFR